MWFWYITYGIFGLLLAAAIFSLVLAWVVLREGVCEPPLPGRPRDFDKEHSRTTE